MKYMTSLWEKYRFLFPFLWSGLKIMMAFFSSLCVIYAFEAFIERDTSPLYDIPGRVFLIVSLLLTMAVLILPQTKIRAVFFAFFYVLIFGFNFIQVEHLILFGTKLNYSSALTLMNTDPRTITEFIGHFLSWKTMGGIVFSLFPFIWMAIVNVPYQIRINLEIPSAKKDKSFILLPFLGVLIVTALLVYEYPKNFPFYDAALISSYQDMKDFEKRSAKMKEFDLHDIQVSSSDTPQLHVVVIGESARREEMSLYGNVLQTTPFADSIKDSLYIFDDVTSWSAQTAIMMEKLLTLSETQKDRAKMWEEPSLIDFYNAAGFETYWISAHSMYGLFDNYAHLLQRVKHPVFINKHQNWNDGFKKHKLDAGLLPAIDQALADTAPKKVIFIHLMGSHISYQDRYPKGYQEANPEFGILENNANPRYISYVKSIHYTDWMLSEIFKRVQKDKTSSSFILYFSDHAEGVSLLNACYCHADSKRDPEQLEVPFFVWLSDVYKKENADFVKPFNTYLERPYETNTWVHSMLDLSRIAHPKIDPAKSLFNPNFKPVTKRRHEEWLQNSQR